MILPIYIAILILLGLIGYPFWKKSYIVKKWRRSLKLDRHEDTFNRLFQDVNGFALSQKARSHQDAMEYTYGEIEFTSFIALIACTNPSPQTRFYDLGSGTGKAVFASAMVFRMQACCGIELFQTLHEAALQQQQKLQQLPAYHHCSPIRLICGNFLQVDISDASLVFINATGLFGETWEKLNHRLMHELQPGTIIITTSKPLISMPDFQIIHTTRVSMSWGIVTAYIQKR
jgi:hypothetical protein